jgi:hypothetical protein
MTIMALLLSVSTGAWAQEVIPETLDFTSNSWGIPSGSTEKTAAENSYTSGGYTITLCGSSGNGYYFSPTEPYILLGKQGAYLQLPAFSSAVDSIKVVGSPNASTSVEQNIYVDVNNSWVAVSTPTTGMKNVTQKYVIDENYRAAGNIYFIKVDNNYNTQIKKVLVYFTPAPAGYTVSLKDGVKDADKWTVKVGNGDYQALPLKDVAKGAALTLKYDGTKKVKSVKAVKKAEAPHLVIEDKNNYFGIGNQKFYFTEGETWTQAMTNHPENAAAGWVIYNDRLRFKPDVYGYAIFIIRSGDYYIIEDTILSQPIDTSKTYMFEGTTPT